MPLAPNQLPDDVNNADNVDVKPRRVELIANPFTDQAEGITVLLNPSRLREVINVEWSRLPVIGLDHEIPHYSRTKSIEIPMSFHFSSYEAGRLSSDNGRVDSRLSLGPGQVLIGRNKVLKDSMDFANFLRSLCFPTRAGLRPPTVLVAWPNVVTFTAVVASLAFDYMKFDRSLAPIVYQADVTFLEVRVTRRFSEDVRARGLFPDTDQG